MSTLVTDTNLATGFNVDMITVEDLFSYDYSLIDTGETLLVFDDSENYTEFLGTGMVASGVPDPLTDMTAGTVTSINLVRNNVTVFQVTGLSISAAQLFDAYLAGDTQAAWTLILAGDDEITGSNNGDLLRGFDGNDQISGGDGSDELHGGDGDDNLRGDEGGDVNQGDDFLYGGSGNDYFKGGAGNDYIDGGDDYDTVDYSLETDLTGDDATHGIIVNLSDEDLLNVSVAGIGLTNVLANTAVDTRNYTDTLFFIEEIFGTGYDDIIVGDNNDNSLIGGGGSDILAGGGGDDYLEGGEGSDFLSGGDGENLLFGNEGDDEFAGGEQGNFFVGGEGTDTYAGGASGQFNHDKISYEWETGGTGIVATFGLNGNVTIVDTYGNTETGTEIEEIKGSAYADTFNGGAGNDQAEGMGGNDVFNMGAGFDHLEYQHEVDAGATRGIIVNLSAAAISANIGSGLQTVLAGRARDSFGDTDTLNSVERVDGTQFTDYIVGGNGSEEFNGNGGADTILSGAGNDYLGGEDGNDVLKGGTGSDTLDGGTENDHLYGGHSADEHRGGLGIDYARYDDANYGNLTIRLDNSNLNAGAAAVGDTYNGIEGLVAGAGNDTLVGNAGANYLIGGVGNDTLFGLAGADTLTGGLGADKFRFSSALGATNVDRIVDFAHHVDDIVLTKAFFAKIGISLTATEFRVGTKALDANDYIIYDRAHGILYYDANGNAAGGQIRFATVNANTLLDVSDFIMA